MRFLGVELKFGSHDIWHKGNLTKLSDLENDIGAGEPGGVTKAYQIGTTEPINKDLIWIDTN